MTGMRLDQLNFYLTIIIPAPHSKLFILTAIFSLIVFSFCASVHAHPVADDVVDELNQRIKKDPKNAELYLKRGVLLRESKRWDEAVVDFELASKLDSELKVVDLAKGQLFLEAGWPKAAEFYLRLYLSVSPQNPKALLLLARSLRDQGLGLEAGNTYTEFLQLTKNPKPDYYLERAEALLSVDKDSDALIGLDEGLARFGPITSLQQMALEIDLENKNYDSSLNRLNLLVKNSPRKEYWLLRRGEILEKIGRKAEAKKSYEEALKNLESRPAHRRNLPVLVKLEKEIREAVARLERGI